MMFVNAWFVDAWFVDAWFVDGWFVDAQRPEEVSAARPVIWVSPS